MTKHVIYGAFGLAASVVLAAAIYFDKPAPAPAGETLGLGAAEADTQSAAVAESPAGELYEVAKVIDGDTITIKVAGKQETVRLIGIDTPETGANAECFATEATAALKVLFQGTRVRLEKDQTQGERDKYNRLLAYVFTDTGVNVAEYLIKNGFGREYTYNKAYKYQAAYKAAQKSAQDTKKGLWAPGACTNTAPAKQAIQEEPVSAPVQQKTVQEPIKKEATPEPAKEETVAEEEKREDVDTSSYICSTNKYNCTDFATHAEAQAVFEQCGGSSNDIHKLDSNKDGEACESLP